jgi:hypothetical protein
MKFQIFNKFLLAASVFAICLLSFSQTDAQKKRRPKSSVPQPVATPPSTTSTLLIPEVIRRADENEVENPTLVSDETLTTDSTQSEDAETLRLKINELTEKLKAAESGKSKDADAMEKKLLLNLDILTKAEQRTESLRKQLYDMVEKENAVNIKVEQLNYEMRPEMIERNISMAGSLRPENLRETRLKSLQSEKANLENLLLQITANREKLELSVQRAEFLVDKIRLKFEKEIDISLGDVESP